MRTNLIGLLTHAAECIDPGKDTGATGEPGNWDGARPIVECVTELRKERDDALALLRASNTGLHVLRGILRTHGLKLGAKRADEMIAEIDTLLTPQEKS